MSKAKVMMTMVMILVVVKMIVLVMNMLNIFERYLLILKPYKGLSIEQGKGNDDDGYDHGGCEGDGMCDGVMVLIEEIEDGQPYDGASTIYPMILN